MSPKCFMQRRNCDCTFVFQNHYFISVENRLMGVRLERGRPFGRMKPARNENLNQGGGSGCGKRGSDRKDRRSR